MKICYIAHPIGGDVENNLADLRRIVRKINLEQPAVIPFVPYYADVVSLDDSIPAERARGVWNATAVLHSGVVKEVWLTGDRMSPGMAVEMTVAKELGIPVIDLIGKL